MQPIDQDKLKQFIQQTNDSIIIEFNNSIGWIVENKTFNLGEKSNILCQGKSHDLNIAIDNFLYDWEKQSRSNIDEEEHIHLF